MGTAHLVLSCCVVVPAQPGAAPPVPVLLGSAALVATAGEGKMKRDLSALPLAQGDRRSGFPLFCSSCSALLCQSSCLLCVGVGRYYCLEISTQ